MQATSSRIRAEPIRAAADTWLIRELVEIGGGLFLYVNSLVVRGSEPVLIDAGSPANRDAWLHDVFGIVEPEDVRWILISHVGFDHAGNLDDVMARCPNATIVMHPFLAASRGVTGDAPGTERIRLARHHDRLDIGDRSLHLLRPPLYDSPSTLGAFDSRTGIYWASAAFGLPVSEPTDDAGEAAQFDERFVGYHLAMSPWVRLADPVKFAEHVRAVEALGAATIASAHGPLIRAPLTRRTIDLIRGLAGSDGRDERG